MTAKLYALIPRRPDISVLQFHEHWRTTHADLARMISTLRQYVQSHRIPVDTALPTSPYEGIAEAYFDDAATGLAMGKDPDYVDHAMKDEPNFMDMSGLAFLVTTEHVVTQGPVRGNDAEGVKLLQLFRRPKGADPVAWQQDLLNAAHERLTIALGAQRHVLAVCVPESYSPDSPQPQFDAVRELTWSSVESFAGARDSPTWGWLIDDDLMDRGSVTADLAEENRVIWQVETS